MLQVNYQYTDIMKQQASVPITAAQIGDVTFDLGYSQIDLQFDHLQRVFIIIIISSFMSC